MAKLQVYTLGHHGVIIDFNPLEPAALPVDAFRSAQNCNHDPIAEHGGAIRKRPGLKQFNLLSAGGPILGGILMSVVDTAKAPTPPTVPGVPGAPTPGTPGVIPGGPPPPVGIGGPPLFPNSFGKRLVLIGRDDNGGSNLNFGNSWFVADTKFQDPAIILLTSTFTSATTTTAGPPSATQLGNLDGLATYGGQITTIANGNFYYPQGSGTAAISPTLPLVRRLSSDGSTDSPVIQIPDSAAIINSSTPAPSHLVSVTGMTTEFGNGDALYVSVLDKVTTGASAGSYGRVFRVSGLDSGTYTITTIYDSFVGGTGVNGFDGSAALPTVPSMLMNFTGGLWIGTWRGVAGLAAGPAIGQLRPNSNATPYGWEIVNSNVNATAHVADIQCMQAYNGRLYVGYINRGAGVTDATIISYTASPVTSNLELTGNNGDALGAAADPNGFVSMALFNGNLYASYYNALTSAYIYQFDGTSWTIVWTGSVSGTIQPLSLQVDNGVMYAFGLRKEGIFGGGALFLWTTDAVTFTSGSFPVVNVGFPVPVLFGITQA